jgi:hypothetical protein
MTGGLSQPAEPLAGPARSRRVPGFLPSRHGLHFANRFPPGPTVRLGPIDPRVVGLADAAAGLCGGMSFTVRDLWEAGREPPPDATPPVNGSRRFIALVRRQVESLDWLRLPVRFWTLAALHPDPATWWSEWLRRRPLPELVRDVEWPRIRTEIDAGRLAQVGLVRATGFSPARLTLNHQVLAWGYEEAGDRTVVHLYDPNWPDRDDVEVRVEYAGSGSPRFAQSTGERLHGFFLAPYRRRDPRAWRS